MKDNIHGTYGSFSITPNGLNEVFINSEPGQGMSVNRIRCHVSGSFYRHNNGKWLENRPPGRGYDSLNFRRTRNGMNWNWHAVSSSSRNKIIKDLEELVFRWTYLHPKEMEEAETTRLQKEIAQVRSEIEKLEDKKTALENKIAVNQTILAKKDPSELEVHDQSIAS